MAKHNATVGLLTMTMVRGEGEKKRWAWPQVACNHIRAEGWTK